MCRVFVCHFIVYNFHDAIIQCLYIALASLSARIRETSGLRVMHC